MEPIRDRLGTELWWDGDRFEAHVTRRTERLARGVTIGACAIACVAVAGLAATGRGELIGVAGLATIVSFQAAFAWALLGSLTPRVGAVVARRGSLEIDGRTLPSSEAAVVLDPPGRGAPRVHLVAGGITTKIAVLDAAQAARVSAALAQILGVSARAPTPAELVAARLPRRVTFTVGGASLVTMLVLAATHVALVVIGVRDADAGRLLATIVGPVLVLAPVPLGALVRRLALGPSAR